MHIQVSGQHISMGSSIQEYVIEKISAVVKKYSIEAQSGHVHFSKHGREFACDIVVYVPCQLLRYSSCSCSCSCSCSEATTTTTTTTTTGTRMNHQEDT